MKKLSPTTITLITLAGSVVLLGALYAYLFYSLIKMGEKRHNFAGEIKNADNLIKEEGEARGKLSSYFIKDGEQAEFVSSIESACAELSLSCDTLSLSESVSDGSSPIKMLSMVIEANGSFENLNTLLARFERSKYPLVLSRVMFTSGWEGSFTLSVPVLTTE